MSFRRTPGQVDGESPVHLDRCTANHPYPFQSAQRKHPAHAATTRAGKQRKRNRNRFDSESLTQLRLARSHEQLRNPCCQLRCPCCQLRCPCCQLRSPCCQLRVRVVNSDFRVVKSDGRIVNSDARVVKLSTVVDSHCGVVNSSSSVVNLFAVLSIHVLSFSMIARKTKQYDCKTPLGLALECALLRTRISKPLLNA